MADSFLSRILRPLGFGEIAPADPRRTVRFLPLPVQSAGVTLTYDAALQLSTVWACMDAITKAVSASRWNVFQTEGKNRAMQPDDPLVWTLNTRPNPETTAIAFRESLLYQAISWGNAYAEIVRNQAGKIVELWPLFSDRMLPRRAYNEDGTWGRLLYDYFQFSGGWVTLEASQVLHIRGPSINGLLGENMIARAAKAIALGVAAERFASSYFANDSVVNTILSYPKTLNDDALERLRSSWADKHTGPDKAFRPVILENGVTIQNLTHKPEDMQLMDARRFSNEEICRFFGVPPYKVQSLERATFNNIEQLGMEFVRDALTPWALRLEQEVDFKCFPQKKPWRHTKIDMDWLTHGDSVSRWTAYQMGRRMGVLSADDILEREGRNTLGGIDGGARFLELSMTTPQGVQAAVDLIVAQTEVQETQAKIAGETHAQAQMKTEQMKTQGITDDGGNDGTDGSDDGGGNEGIGGDDGGGDPDQATDAEEPSAPATPKQKGAGGKRGPKTERRLPILGALRDAIVLMASRDLERFRRRLQNADADMKRHGKTAEETAARIKEERDATTASLVSALREAFEVGRESFVLAPTDRDFENAANEVFLGTTPGMAATALAQTAFGKA